MLLSNVGDQNQHQMQQWVACVQINNCCSSSWTCNKLDVYPLRTFVSDLGCVFISQLGANVTLFCRIMLLCARPSGPQHFSIEVLSCVAM